MLTSIKMALGWRPSTPWKPQDDTRNGLRWVLATRHDNGNPIWVEICDTCGGNCGQCGNTQRLGDIGIDPGYLAEKTQLLSGLAVGFRR